jgi:pimeloyl-ACP methyl ester carboxylesterase
MPSHPLYALLATAAGLGLAGLAAREVRRRAAAHALESRQARERYVGAFPVHQRSTAVLGCRTHLYESVPERASQPPLLLIHGGVIEAASWLETIALLGQGRRVLMPDLPAHGTSAFLRPARLVNWLEAFVESELRDEPFDLCGHSMGGGLALHYAAQHSGRIRKLILCAPVGTGQYLPRLWPEPRGPGGPGLWPLHKSFIHKVWGDPAAITDEQSLQFGVVFRDFFYSARWWWYLSGGMKWLLDIPDKTLGAIRCPALFIWGERDRVVRFNGHKTLRRIQQIPGARVHFLEGLGHLPQIESPQAFNAVVSAFLGT